MFRDLPVGEVASASESENEWQENINRLIHLFLNRDPREFLRWDVVSATMFIGRADYISTELGFLKSLPAWQDLWRPAIKESPLGRPKPCIFHPDTSCNLVHHAYHVARFEEQTKAKVADMDLVFEFGGGYGSMCRLFHNLGFRGKYVILDLPAFSTLQAYYLKGLGLEVRGLADFQKFRNGIFCASNLGQLRMTMEGSIPAKGSLFLATWSLSETPLHVRADVLPLLPSFESFLIAFQNRFGEVDNLQYFKVLQNENGIIPWISERLEHLPGNNYLFGKKA